MLIEDLLDHLNRLKMCQEGDVDACFFLKQFGEPYMYCLGCSYCPYNCMLIDLHIKINTIFDKYAEKLKNIKAPTVDDLLDDP